MDTPRRASGDSPDVSMDVSTPQQKQDVQPQPPSETTTLRAKTDADFNVQSPERAALLQQLSNAPNGKWVSTSFWACLQVCDLGNLAYILDLAHHDPVFFAEISDLCVDLPKKWLEDHAAFYSIASGASSTSRDSLSKCLRIVARSRDSHQCVLSGTKKTYQPIWIFPERLTRPAFEIDYHSPSIWRYIEVFWDQSTTQRWRDAVFNNPSNATNATSGSSSLICLRNDLAYGFKSGQYGLRPVELSQDKRELEVEFHWLPRESHGFGDLVDMRKQPLSYKDLDNFEGLKFSPTGSDELVKSGHRFKLVTNDPYQRPLPDFDLLDMAWHFSRIVAMSSAIEFVSSAQAGKGPDSDDDDRTLRGLFEPARRLSSNFDPTQRTAEWVASSAV
ncbi:hypothetical protein N7532_006749 [Penicillium argentinense]|uniref:HNH nuclease domain-containing protein n=1 Tax=Penicillium argentinense TaxID=1131581 RepID=A0A9W9KB74_9EURO|nr:uncharacterized protein N7532_006749 [Penicillium argentinense]KAJ5099748.1 hypothetical protein N7532_006749 [Penicillium argentinense]